VGQALRFVACIFVCSCAAIAVGVGGCHSAFAQGTAPSLADLQLTKLQLEIDKLEVDKITTLVTSILGILSALGFIIGFFIQRWWAQKSQEQSEMANLKLKIAEFVMSSVGPTMARQRIRILRDLYKDRSVGPTAARQRLRIFPDLYNNRNRALNEFLVGLDETALINQDAFPGTRRDQLKLELFKGMAAQAGSEEEAKRAFKEVFPDENFPNI
jgi:hypothetical protein